MSRKFVVNINGRNYDVEVTEVTGGNQAAARPAEARTAQPAAHTVTQAAAPAPALISAPAAPAAAGTKITAPMPGTVLKVNVELGDDVKKGDVLLILEAMKMENEIVASKDGIVASIHVAQGSKVAVGEVMVSIQ